MIRIGLLSAALFAAAPAASVLAEDEAHEAAGEEEEHGGGAHHGGPIHFKDVLTPEFGAAVINFVLLLFVLRRLGARPLRNFLTDRRRAMERGINEAAELKQKAEALHKEYSDRLAQLDKELQQLRADIARSAEEDKQRIVAEAEETTRRLRAETEMLIDQHRKGLTADVRRDVVEAASAAAEQMLRGALTEGDQQRLADSYAQRVKATGTGKRTEGSL